MGLAAVPFGTAQVHGDPIEYKIQVKERREGEVERHYSIELKREFGGENFACMEFVWTGKKLTKLRGVDSRECGYSLFMFRKMGKLKSRRNAFASSFWHVASFFIDCGEKCKVLAPSFRSELIVKTNGDEGDFFEAFLLIQGNEQYSQNQKLPIISDIPVHTNGVEKVYVIGDRYDTSKVPDCVLEDSYKGISYNSHMRGEESESSESEEGVTDEVSEDNESKEKEPEKRTEAKSMTTSERIKALFKADRARREKDPEREKERRMREEAQIRACDRIRKLIRIDRARREIKENDKIGENEIRLEEPKVEDEKKEKLFDPLSKEDYFKGFDAFKENLAKDMTKSFSNLIAKDAKRVKGGTGIGEKKSKEPEIFNSEDCFEFSESRLEFSEIVNPNQIKIEDKKEDEKIDQSEINFGNKSLARVSAIISRAKDRKSRKIERIFQNVFRNPTRIKNL